LLLVSFVALSHRCCLAVIDKEWIDYLVKGGVAQAELPLALPKLGKLGHGQIAYYLRRGIPVILKDAVRDLPMRQWTCEYIQTEFGGASVRREEEVFEDPGLITKQISVTAEGEISDTAKNQPLFWDFAKASKGEMLRSSAQDVEKITESVKAATEVPYFLSSVDNLATMRNNSKFWMAPAGAGWKAHTGKHCMSTVAITLSGTIRWRFMQMPRKPHPAGYSHGDVYDRDEWEPQIQGDVAKGEAVVFPPAMIHEAVSIGTECAVSAMFQFGVPLPVIHWRTFWPRLRMARDFAECWSRVDNIVTSANTGWRWRHKTPDEKIYKRGIDLYRAMDIPTYNELTVDQIVAFNPKAPYDDSHGEGGNAAANFARDVRAYHDLDVNNYVNETEYAANVLAWFKVDKEATKKQFTREKLEQSAREKNEL